MSAPPAKRVGPFVLGPVLGRGGMATVHLARQEAIAVSGATRLVALKLLTGPADARFGREAAVALRLEHPNIVRTYEVGDENGQAYIAMELLRGLDLSPLAGEAERAGALPLPIVARIGADVARALAYAHDLKHLDGQPMGLVHQDVSPQNVMVTFAGSVRLLDFGIARLASVDASRTDTVSGKPAYLAPEQLEGAKLDRRVDIFALGVVLYELLSGARLFRRPTIAETYRAILLAPIEEVRTARADVPEAVAEVLHRALYRQADARFADAAAFGEAWSRAWAAATVTPASDAEIAAYLAAYASAARTTEEIERSMIESAPTRNSERPLAISSISPRALAEVEASEISVAGVPRRRSIRNGSFAAFALVLASLGAFAFTRFHTPSDVDSPAVPSSSGHLSEGDAASPFASSLGTTDAAVVASPLALSLASASSTPVAPAAHVARPGPSTSNTKPVVSAGAPSTAPVVASATASAPAASSFLSVGSNVWGRVLLDGTNVGDSPLVHLPVSAGAHRVTIRTDRGEQTQTASCTSEGETRVKFVF